MAEQKYYTIVTDLGTELMAKAAQNGTKVNITHIAAGDGNGTFYKPTSDMTALKREIWRGTIQNYEIDVLAKNVIKVSGVIPKEVGHFVLREMALFDDKNNMIAVCNAPDLLKAVLEDGALTEAVVYMRIAVTNTQVVTIQVNGSAVYATLQELEAHKTDKNAHQELFEQKADKIDVETALAEKVDNDTFTTELNKKANKTEVETALNGKVDNDTFTTELNKKADKTDVETALNGKVDNDTFTTELDKKVDKTTMTTELNKKVDKTDFTGANIGSLLEAEGWSSGGGEMTALDILNTMKDSSFDWQNNSIAMGASSLLKSANGGWNSAYGYKSLTNNTSGRYNTAVGYDALQSCTTGFYNTAIGTGALNALTTYEACTGIGEHAQVTGNSQVQLGSAAVTVYAQSAVQTRSDARDKTDIQNTKLGLNFIKKLTPRQFRMNSREAYFEQGKQRDFSAKNDGSKAGKRFHQGFVAQEVKTVMDEMGIDFAGYQDHKINGGDDVLSLGYTEFIAPIVKAMQEQQEMIEAQQNKIAWLEQKINEVRTWQKGNILQS